MRESNVKSTQEKRGGHGGAQVASTENQNNQDAIATLKSDHRKVEQLFEKFKSSQDQTTQATVARQVCLELIIHTKLEEEIFYPTCREAGVEDEALNEAQVEHDSAKILIGDVITCSPGDEFYHAKVSVLSEYVKHHVGEEEKPSDGIFAKAQKAGIDMKALGARLQARKADLMAQSEVLKSQPPMPRSLHLQTQQEDYMARYRDRDEQGRFRGDDDDDRRYSRGGGRERDEYGRFMSEDDDDEGSRRRSSRSMGRERDESGRFMSDDDDEGYSRRRSSRSSGRERDEYGRFMSDEDEGYSRGRSSRSSGRERDEYGRFMSDEDEGYSRGRSSRSSGRERDEYGHFMSDEDEGYSRGRSSRGGGRYREDDDDDRRSGRSGWYGDPEGHSEASRRGWEERGGGRYQSRYQEDDDYRRGGSRGGSSGRGRGQGGWFGDPEGHSEASQRGWEERGGSRSRSRYEEDDDDRRGSRGGRGGGRGEGHGGWFGDPEGHSQASRRGWRDR
jgi:hypothetical protein